MRAALTTLALTSLLAPWTARAHCDSLDGPVVTAARQALSTGNIHHVLIWIGPEQEPELKAAFTRALAVRKQGGKAAALADTWFFETLVRLHRAAEGAPYTGLKPAGHDLGPVIPAADRALEAGSAEALWKLVGGAARSGLEDRFRHALAARHFDLADTTAGREYVRAYVQFLHYAERLHQAAAGADAAHEQ